MVLAEFGTGQVFWSMVWFFLFTLWLWLVISVFTDIFRSRDLSGWGKAAWALFVLLLPYLGVFIYLIARGRHMADRALERERERAQMFRDYDATAGGAAASDVDQLTQLAALRDSGALDDDEYREMKSRLMAV